MNVMLSRLQEGMVIVTNRNFLDFPGRKTLLGRMARRWQDERGEAVWTLPQRIAERTANMPGVTMTPSTPKVPRAPSEAETESSSNPVCERIQALSLSPQVAGKYIAPKSSLAASPPAHSSPRTPSTTKVNSFVNTTAFSNSPTTRPRGHSNATIVGTSWRARTLLP
ncbi:hypothetical protein IEO21_09499 [Rhodonia placenta]|uniref:DNA2/NAM7 helicase-like C-terminal domain-containing protein n=1 Tax=Rhodonia placenta TaxID=104341 RepID=A0A8H7NUN4_9APHY|nr:hypothetical protein IEO21_09499 [Postia placenta]